MDALFASKAAIYYIILFHDTMHQYIIRMSNANSVGPDQMLPTAEFDLGLFFYWLIFWDGKPWWINDFAFKCVNS